MMDIDDLINQIDHLTQESNESTDPSIWDSMTCFLLTPIMYVLILLKEARDTIATLKRRIDEQNTHIEDQTVLIDEQVTRIAELENELEQSKYRIHELEEQKNKNSTNSSKPPSTDGFKKGSRKGHNKGDKKDDGEGGGGGTTSSNSHSLREITGRHVGGQPGHKGHHMELPHEPDEVKNHLPLCCQNCPHRDECTKNKILTQTKERRNVIDLKVITHITEYRVCCCCGCPLGNPDSKGAFPEDIRGYRQYGNSFAVLAGLLNNYSVVSFSKMHDIMGSLTGCQLSPATLKGMVKKVAQLVSEVVNGKIKSDLIDSPVCHADETSIRVNGENYWVHTVCNGNGTYLYVHKSRGWAAIEEEGVLTKIKGSLVHDCYKVYDKLDNVKGHGACNSHIQRDLIGVDENYEVIWPMLIKELLLTAKANKEQAIAEGKTSLPEKTINKYITAYRRILELAPSVDKLEPPPAPPPRKDVKKGRTKRTSEENLRLRLQEKTNEVWRFLTDFSVPFDNNLAEQSLRNLKTKVKVIGCFRTEQGAKDYVMINSYLSTAKKHKVGIFQAMVEAFNGNPYVIFGG